MTALNRFVPPTTADSGSIRWRALLAAVAWILLSSSARGNAAEPGLLATAERAVAAAARTGAPWDGPVAGPEARPGRHIVYIAEDLRNGGILGVGRGIREAAAAIGWTLEVIDLQGSDAGRRKGFARAAALHPDGVILGGLDARHNAQYLETLDRQGIPLVGWHLAADPGPVAGTPVAFNVTTDYREVARIAAYFAVADSRGRAGVVIFTDSNFAIATAKANAMAAVIGACDGCRLLAMEDIPISGAEARVPERTRALQRQFGAAWQYSLAINDIYFDFSLPWGAGDDEGDEAINVSAGDGSESAFQRIRLGGLQGATVPEPLNLQGWQLVDELNRLLSGAPPSGYNAPVHLVTAANVNADGGERGHYDPDNGYRRIYRRIWGVDR